MSDESSTKLNNLQNDLFKYLLSTPRTTPSAALCWDFGAMPIKFMIMKEKLTLLYHIVSLDNNSLANEIYMTQKKFKFPGLTSECMKMIHELGIPNITEDNIRQHISKLKWKKIVKDAVKKACEVELKREIKDLKKLKNGPMIEENFSTKSYLKEYCLDEARTLFKYRSKMLNFKFNYKNDVKNLQELWNCDSCQSAIESQDHILWCPAYVDLRKGKSLESDEDLVQYFSSVMKIREKLQLKK